VSSSSQAADVVVVGAGSAGCAAASRLAQRTDLDVCLVEAGPDYGPLAEGRWPGELLDPARMPRTHDWGYLETRRGELRPESRAKVVGGCSAHNQCAAVWGRPEDYDEWAVSGWSHAELRPLIDEVDALVATAPYPDDELAAWQRAFLGAAAAAGFPRIENLDAPGPVEGVAAFHANIRRGVRWSSSFAFLDGARGRDNLTIRDRLLADRLLFDGTEATTLVCRSGEAIVELRADRFLLCAGAYGSPSVLLRSGLDLPAVGRNLHDHCGVRVRFSPSQAARTALEDELTGGRFHASQVILRAASGHAEERFDLHVAPYQTQTDDGTWTFGLLAFDLAPRSRGRVELETADPAARPVIDFGFLTDPDGRDAAVLRVALELARRLADTEPLASAVEREVDPGREGALDHQIRRSLTGYAHAVGTCRLGAAEDPEAVVDPDCRVRGTENVYVADASIIPTIPRANTNLTCFLIGLRGADLVAGA
jgi:choline dehydrogenase